MSTVKAVCTVKEIWNKNDCYRSNIEQDPNTQKDKKEAIYYDKIHHANFQHIKPFFEAKKQQQLNGEEWNLEYLSAFDWDVLLWCLNLLFKLQGNP